MVASRAPKRACSNEQEVTKQEEWATWRPDPPAYLSDEAATHRQQSEHGLCVHAQTALVHLLRVQAHAINLVGIEHSPATPFRPETSDSRPTCCHAALHRAPAAGLLACRAHHPLLVT